MSSNPDAMPTGCPNCGWSFRINAPEHRGERVEELLKSNDPPMESELNEIRSKAAAHVERLSTLDKTIADMQSTLELIQAERKWVDAELAELRKASSPVRRLPGDVLSEIFVACIPEQVLHDSDIVDSLDVQKAPWLLLQICSRWRSVAKAFPRLWSTISLDIDTHTYDDSTDVLLLLGLHLQRSGSHPLNIWIQSNDPDITSDNHILQVLLPSAYRWRHAVIAMLWDTFMALKAVRGSLESLEALHVQATDEEPLEEIAQIDIFRYAPRLRYLCCQNIGLPVTSILTSTSQLTTYEWYHDLTPKYPPRHLEFLRGAPRLERITLECGLAEEENPPPLTKSHLSRLEIAVRKWAIQRACTSLFDCLTLPALAEMSIDLEDQVTFDIDFVIPLLQRSQCQLVLLGLVAPSLTSSQLLELLRAVPSLEILSVAASKAVSDDVLQKLKWRADAHQGADDMILPLLTHIILDNFSGQSASLVEMVESRIPEPGQSLSCSRLQTVTLKGDVDLDIDLSSRMERCCSRGLGFVNETSDYLT